VAEPLGLPVVGDMHEMKTTEFRAAHSNLTWRSRIRHAVVHNANRWERYEAQILQRCARVIVVVPEAAERLARIGIPRTKIVVVSNTEDETTFQVEQPDPDILARYPGWWLASYVGGIGPHRGIDTAIQAVPLAAAEIPNLHLLIVGAQSEAQIRDLTALAEQAGVRERVEILGWQPASTVSSFIQASAVCLVPHHDSEHTQTTVPHKLFQYMMVGRPVVVSSVLPLKRIVEDTRAGLVFDAGDPASLARTWVRLYRDPALHKRLGQNGWQAARGPYAWRHDAAQLVQLYRGVKDEAV